MTNTELFNALSKGGAYTLPFLIKIEHPKSGTLFYVNNNEDITHAGVTYKASAFKYTRPKTIGGVLKNGSLEISSIGTKLLAFVELSDQLFTVEVIGVLDQVGDVYPFKQFHHQYGTATISNDYKVTISFTNDDRLDMTFPPYIFDSENNRGNA